MARNMKGISMDPELVAAILNEAMEHGLRPPLYICVIGINGRLEFVRYAVDAERDVLDVEVLLKYEPEPDFVLPLNVMITDTTGKGVLVNMEHRRGWRLADRN
jgi:uncharacterized protein (DUF302 family)